MKSGPLLEICFHSHAQTHGSSQLPSDPHGYQRHQRRGEREDREARQLFLPVEAELVVMGMTRSGVFPS